MFRAASRTPLALRPPEPEAARRARRLALFGPAFVAAIAYVDPGNFATNFAGGARFGYLLLWVIVSANVIAMFVQSLSAKLGLATGANLPEVCREHFRPPVVRALWVQAELVAMATDLAEVIGGAIALNLLFGLPLLTGGLITGLVAFGLLGLQSRGHRKFQGAVTGLFAVILAGFLVMLLRAPVDPAASVAGLVPRFDGAESLVLATGILGATVMPHAIYLHSALIPQGIELASARQRRFALRTQRADVLTAMGLAGLVNAAMLLVAAALFHGSGLDPSGTLAGAHAGIGTALDGSAALVFALALLASGFASAGVGTYAGQVVMQGFVRRRIPLLVRRALTLSPALVVLALGVDPTRALVLSQVVLSFGIPFALVPLLLLTGRPNVMGELVNRRVTTVVAALVTCVIIGLNAVLLITLL
ncbi:MAG: Nramp family divalent metal transporter [Blastococcus sp.]